MDELATVKSALPSVVMHSGALEPHSLFCAVYTPPPTAAVCDWQSWVVAARAAPDPVASSPAASSPAAARPAALFLQDTGRVSLRETSVRYRTFGTLSDGKSESHKVPGALTSGQVKHLKESAKS